MRAIPQLVLEVVEPVASHVGAKVAPGEGELGRAADLVRHQPGLLGADSITLESCFDFHLSESSLFCLMRDR